MRVDKYKMLKNDMYEITVSNCKYIIHSDLILKSKLLLRNDVNKSELESLQSENQFYEAYNIAVRMLSIKVRCYKELFDALRKKNYDESKIKQALDLLVKQGYLSDKTYAMYYVHDQILLNNYGPLKIRKNLFNKDIDEKYINEALMTFDLRSQKEKVEKMVNKFIKTNRNYSAYTLKQKTISYLLNLGYTRDIIFPFVEKITFDDKDIYQKELEKVTRILSRKYSGEDLKKRIKQKMYSKGFNTYDI